MSSQHLFLRGRGRGRGANVPQQQQRPQSWAQVTNKQQPSSSVRPGQSSNDLSDPKSPSVESERLLSSFKSVENLFAKARSQHMQSAQQFLQANNDYDEDESEDEEEDIGSLVLNGVFKSYATSYENGNKEDVQAAQERLLHSFRSGTSACLVCIETITKDEAIWSCSGCSAMFHLPCIQKWVKEGVYQKQYAAGELDKNIPTEGIPWHCPKCRYEYPQKDCPTKYFCFCGKQRDPKFDPWIVPHSCGAVCSRKLKPECGHQCLLLCHPGPCPPCPVTLKSKCFCGRSSPRMTRCSASAWSCGQVCGQMLSCRQHKCEDKCHIGKCPPCTKMSNQNCCCGNKTALRPCNSSSWNCDKPCMKPLSCGHHLCEKVCHEASCGDCPRAGNRKCPCGKTASQLPCTEDIPTCGDTCGRQLACGHHSCAQRCHTGTCGQCIQVANKKCRCGQKQKEIACAKEFLCEKKCINMRDCEVHKCNRKCCDRNCPSCEQTCGKTLRCRNHKCASRCHRGPCYPCPLTVNITCHCKKTKITVPCGKERQTKPPRCNLACRAKPACHHPARQKHRCHFSDCPPCNFVCGSKLKDCEHTCPAVCHDSVRVRIVDTSVKAGPWEAKPVWIENIAKPCPPCQVAIPIQCLGKHETSEIPCHRVSPYSCGRKCGRNLACGNHQCEGECHTVTGAADKQSAGSECPTCEAGCQLPRPEGCTHKCMMPCHAAPCKQCRIMVRMRCHCQTIVKHIECFKWTAASKKEKDALKTCGQPCPKEMPCGHPCGAVCHSGLCPNVGKCVKKVALKCRCKRIKKDVLCQNRKDETKPECDDVCRSAKKVDIEALRKKEEEEKKKQDQELQEFERKMKGRRKKPRHQQEQEVTKSAWSQYKVYVLAGTLAAFAVAISLAGWTVYG